MTRVVEFQDVSFTYVPKSDRRRMEKLEASEGNGHNWGSGPEELWALSDVSFSLEEGDFLGIAGHTGSGKSTLIQLAAGLLKPSAGRIVPDKADPTGIGIVFQYPEHQLFAQTVFDDVAFGPRNLGLKGEEVERRVKGALSRVNLDAEEIGSKSPFSLSGGQQRRVAIAGVLAMQPRTLILDEPTAGLDPRAHDRLLAMIRQFHEEIGITIVLVSHNMDDIAALCDRMLVLNKGRVFADGTPASVFADAEGLKKIGLGIPHTLRLANALGMDCGDEVPDILQLARTIAEVRHDS